VRIARTGSGWAFLAAVGAAYLVSALALTILTPLLQWVINLDQVLNKVTFPPPPVGIGMAATWGLSVAAGAFVGVAVARAAGGPVAAALYASVVVLTAAIVVARAIGAAQRMIDSFTIISVGNVPWATALTFLPAGLALVAGWAAGGWLRRGAGRANAALESAGAYSLVAVAGSTFGPYPDLLTGPYSIVGLDAQRHGAIVLTQSLAAGALYAMRTRRPPSFGAVLVFALIGLAAVLPTDVMPILFTLFLDWTYVPLSLMFVPLATAVVGLAAVGASRIVPGRTGAMSG
jgi:hypothetical protein